MAMTVTAAICTRDRPALLERAVRSLLEQTVAAAEVLVVDNAPSDERAARLLANAFPGVRYVLEPVPGLDFARNRALRAATSPVVAFLDDDAVADRAWVQALAAAFAEFPELGCCTGRVEALSLATDGQRAMEANGGYDRGLVRIRLPADAQQPLRGHRAPLIAWAVSVGSGCNLAVRRELALELGGFDEALDLGAALPGGGDHDMLWRMLAAGKEVLYEPAARARHEHRRDLSAAYDQIIGHQRALVAFLTKAVAGARGGERLGAAAFLGWRLLKPGMRLLHRAAGRDSVPAAVLLRMWLACWAGLVAYPRARRIARTRLASAPALETAR
jgi:glycosyltransferase involved in cell wall biosynthesis